MADNSLVSLLAGYDPLAPQIMQALGSQRQLDLAQDNSAWGNQQGPLQAVARALMAFNGRSGVDASLGEIKAQREGAQSDLAKIFASADPYAYVNEHPEISPLARAMVLNGATPESVASARVHAAQGRQLNARTGALEKLPQSYQDAVNALSGAGGGPSGPAGPVAPSAGGRISGLGPNQSTIAATLASLGHSPAQIAGALGWGTQESGTQDTNTALVNNTGRDGQYGGSYGWQQWLAERRTALNDFARASGTTPDDPATQARFFDREMRTPGSGAGEAAQNAYWSASSPDQAVVAMAHYGRGGGYTPQTPQNTLGYPQRLSAAQQIYELLNKPQQVAQANTGMASDAAPADAGIAALARVGGAPAGEAPAVTTTPNTLQAADKTQLFAPTQPTPVVNPGVAALAAAGRSQSTQAPVAVPNQAAPAGGIDRRALAIAALVAQSELAGVPGVGKALAEAYYNSPGFKGQVTSAETEAKNKSDLEYKPTIAGRTKEAELPATNAAEAYRQMVTGEREKDVAAAAPQKLGAGETVYYPPNSVGAQNIRAAQARGEPLSPNVGVGPDGGVRVSSGNQAAFGQSLAQLTAKDLVERHGVAMSAADSLKSTEEALRLLNSGVYTGTGANLKVALGKAAGQLGFHYYDDDVANSEAFVASRAQEVGRIIKLFGAGTGLSDADREYATRAAAGQITLNDQSIHKILDINARASRNAIEQFNKDVAQVDPTLTPYSLSVQLPPQSESQLAAPKSADEFAKLPSGTHFMDPEGNVRVKP